MPVTGPAVPRETLPPPQDVTRGAHRLLLAGSPLPSPPHPLRVAGATSAPSLLAVRTASRGTLAMCGTSVVVTAAGRAPGLDWVGLGVLLSPHRARDGPPLRATGPGVSSIRVRAWRPPLPR